MYLPSSRFWFHAYHTLDIYFRLILIGLLSCALQTICFSYYYLHNDAYLIPDQLWR